MSGSESMGKQVAWINPVESRIIGAYKASIPFHCIEATTLLRLYDSRCIPIGITMVNYRRNFVLGGTYFFTVTLRMRNSRQLVESINSLRMAFRKTREAKPFRIDAMVVLPEHLHSIWTLPPDDSDYPGRWKAIKSIFTRELEKSGVPVGKRKDGSALIWQRRYWEHTIRDADDLNRHTDYIHFNPVKHGLVERVIDWPYSSFHRYVRQSLLPPNWAGENFDDMKLGEPDFKS